MLPVVESSDVPTTDIAALITPRFAVEVLPVPPLVEEAATLLTFVPPDVPVTVTVTVQLEFTASVAPLKLTLGPFADAVTVPPAQVVALAGAAAFCIPVGYISVKLTLVNATILAAGLVIVKVMMDVPFTAIGFVPKDLTIVGAASTVRVAFAVPPVKATGPPAVTAVVVFKAAPAVLLVTLACSWQLAPAFSVATFKRRLPSPTALAAPLVFVAVPQAAGVKVKVVFCSVTPTGKVSGNCTVVIAATFAAGFVTVRLRTLVPPTAILAGVKLFATVGGI